jgi:hypothetical protein
MQIGLLNHLNFPKSSNQPLAANTGDDSTAVADGSAMPARAAVVRETRPTQEAPGVILKIQPDAAASAAVAIGLVYSNGSKAGAGSDADSDTDRMAAQYSQAVQRSAGSTTNLTLGKDGVLVAKPASASDDKPQDFVSFAVHAMRDFADEQDRLKSTSQSNDGAVAASLIPRSLAEVQKLAARFKLFA